MTNIEVNEETQKLLNQKGLKCVCQLCDCGRWHKHVGCKIPHQTVFSSFNDPGESKVQSDYQARFTDYQSQSCVKPIYPVEVQKDLFPPPMDLHTVKQLSYQNFRNPEMRKPCKLKGEIDQLMTGEFIDKTNYKDAFIGYTAKPANLARPSTVLKRNESKVASETEYMNGFQKKAKIPEVVLKEKPSYTYELLYPNQESLPKKSVSNSDHDGQKGERAQMCALRKSNVDIGVDGEFDHTTTNGIHFKSADVTARVVPIKRNCAERISTGKFNAISQKQADFRYDEKKARSARAITVSEHPSLIKLSMDIPHDFSTVASLSYHKWLPDQVKRPVAPNKPTSKYTSPKVKFDAVPQSHTDYINHGIRPRTEMYHPPEIRKSSAKVSGESSYNTSFKNYGKVERKFYGEYHQTNLQLPPKREKFNGTTVMRNDYKINKVEKRSPFKPSHGHQQVDAKFEDATEYKERYLPKEPNICTFSKYLALSQPRKQMKMKDEMVT